MAAQETVNEASSSIKKEDKRLEEDIQSIMGVIQRKLVGKEMMIDQWEISDTQRGNLRDFIEGARSAHEKLKKNAVKVLSMLDEAMIELDDAVVQQEDIQTTRAKIHSKLLKRKEIRSKQQTNSKEEIYKSLLQEIKSEQQEVKSKQQKVGSILDKVKKRLQIPVTTKVLCWNIHGATDAGKTKIRNCLVPAVVKLVHPDILLLQQTSDVIVEHCKKIKNYREKRTGPKQIIDSLVLYDADKCEVIQNTEKIFPENQSLEEVVTQSLTSSIEEIVPNEHETVHRQELKRIIRSRICYVGLTMQHIPTNPMMIFIAFHNIYKPEKGCKARETARIFCKLVSEIHRRSGCVVVAGADLNHQPSTRFRSKLGATLIPYEVTDRRSEKTTKDYVIVAPDDTGEEASAEALNFIDTEESDFLHSLMSKPIPKPDSDGTIEFKNDDISEALDHDPLVCELKINMQAEDESEDDHEDESEDESEDDHEDESEAVVPEP